MAIELRIALLLVGLAVLAGLYFFGKAKRISHKKEDLDFNFEADKFLDVLEIDQALELDAEENQEAIKEISDLVHEDIVESPRTKKSTLRHQPSLLDQKAEKEVEQEQEQEEKLVVLHVVAKRPQKFNGKGIINLTKELDIEYRDNHIFQKSVERFSGKKALYIILNVVKPGTFELDAMHQFETPGISFVMNLPGPEEGLKAFNIMLEDARKFAERLNGDILDESRNKLSPQTIAHLQEEVQLFSLKNSRSVHS